jgi:predicted SnoaL-like aldol condensation-catalyzing enzyme
LDKKFNTMKKYPFLLLLIFMFNSSFAQESPEEKNKQVMLKFYQDLWANNHTDRYAETVADTYVVHDIGDRKNVREPAIRQKEIADQFWENGELQFELDYQVAEGDLVVTRWYAHFTPSTLKGSLMYGESSIPIINVARLENGKIVELWNHRHDIDSGMTMKYTLKGVVIGLLIGLIAVFFSYRYGKSRNEGRLAERLTK